MEENTEDLIKQFKSKVEEAISLLPQIPELHRHEVWTYWQIISVAVKAAVGGRGPIVAKPTATSQGRPRGRPRLHTQQGDSLPRRDGKNQGNSKNRGSGVGKPGRKGRKDKQKMVVSDRNDKVDLWLPGRQCGDVKETKRFHSGDKSSTVSADSSAVIVSPTQSSIVGGNVSPAVSVLMPADKSVSPVVKNSTANGINSESIFHKNITIVPTEKNGSIPHDASRSGPEQTSAAELPCKFETPENNTSLLLNSTALELCQSVNDAHKEQESNYEGERRSLDTNASLQMENDTGRQTWDNSEKITHDPLETFEAVAFSVCKNSKKKTAEYTGFENLTISPDESMASPPLKNNNTEESETDSCKSVTLQDVSTSSTFYKTLETVEKTVKVSDTPGTGEKLSAKTDQSLATSGTHPTQREDQKAVMSQDCKNLATELARHSTKTITKDTTSNGTNLGTPSASPSHGASCVKRKRGRPRKHTDKLMQGSATPAFHTPASVISHQPSKSPQTSAASVDCEDKAVRFSPSTDGKRQENLTSVVRGSDVQLKVKNKKFKNQEPVSSVVRRSERRAAPNRDKIFCYFSTSHRGRREEGDAEVKDEEEEEAEEDNGGGGDQMNEEVAGDVMGEDQRIGTETEEEKAEENMKKNACPKCHVVLKSVSSLTAHMRIHTGERPFACPVCHKTFTTKGNCERHEVTHVGLKAFACPQCHKKFTEKKSLKIHMRAHTGERPYQCRVCGMRFFQSGTLKTHMDRHTGHKGHLCELCGKAFRQNCQLRVHMRRHNMHMPFQCQHCPRTFYTKSDMERHELRHTGERPFSCDQCSKTFTRQQYLREHQNSHLGRRPYKCVVCGLTFHTFASCHRHVNRHKLPVQLDQPAQQIHVEVTPDTPTHQVMEQVQVILKQQQLTGDYQTPNVQTFILPDQSISHTGPSGAVAATSTTTIVGPSPQSSAHTILSNLGLEVEESSEIYHVTLVEPAQNITIPTDQRVVASAVSVADFSAMNLLANATTQLSTPP